MGSAGAGGSGSMSPAPSSGGSDMGTQGSGNAGSDMGTGPSGESGTSGYGTGTTGVKVEHQATWARELADRLPVRAVPEWAARG